MLSYLGYKCTFESGATPIPVHLEDHPIKTDRNRLVGVLSDVYKEVYCLAVCGDVITQFDNFVRY